MARNLGQIIKPLLGIWMALVLVSIFLILPQYEGLGNAGRIMILHVPTAWVSVLAFAVSALYSGIYLKNGRTSDDDRAKAAAESGFLFTILATITGMIFSQVVWGVFWNWDPRQTSIFVLLLIYAALFALRSAIEQDEQRRKLSAVYSLFAFVTVPFLIFVAPRLSNSTLHPNCAFLPGSKCDGIDMIPGKIGLLGDRKVQLITVEHQDDIIIAQVKVSEPGLKSEAILVPTFNLTTGNVGDTPEIPGVRYRLTMKPSGQATNQVVLNISAPGQGLLNNQRTLFTFLASIVGFTGLFFWIFHVRVMLLGVQWELAQRSGASA